MITLCVDEVLNTINIPKTLKVSPKTRKSEVKKRNVVLKIDTYERLEKFLLELARERGERLTFDDAIKALLNSYEQYRSVEARERGGHEGISS